MNILHSDVLVLLLDRRPVQVDLWTSAPSYELEFDGIPRTVTATNRMEELKFFLDFSTPITNSTEQILNALHPSSGLIVPIHSRGHGNRSFAFVVSTNIIFYTMHIFLSVMSSLQNKW